MEGQANTSAGRETASETVARINAAREAAKSAPAPLAAPKNNAVLDALTARLEKQGQGISSSSSSNIQNSINEAISGVERAGQLTSQSLQSERGREVGFAQDRASATYSSALEGRTGFATQTIALRELTETTEKSIRDLDGRYREAIMNNDANTASTVAGLRMEKLKFLNTQEENYFRNMISVAGMKQSNDQFVQEQDRLFNNSLTEAKQFEAKMAQTDDQFTQNMGIQYKQLDLQSQELDIARQRNNISQQEFNLRKSELEMEKATTRVTASVFSDLRNQVVQGGQRVEEIDPTEYALWKYEQEVLSNPNTSVTFEDVVISAQQAKADLAMNNVMPPSEPVGEFISGPLAPGGVLNNFSSGISSTMSELRQQLLGVRQGEELNDWMNNNR